MKTPYKIKDIGSGYCAVFVGNEQLTGGIAKSKNDKQALQAIWTLEEDDLKHRYIYIKPNGGLLDVGIYRVEVLEKPLKIGVSVALYMVDGYYLSKEIKIIGEVI